MDGISIGSYYGIVIISLEVSTEGTAEVIIGDLLLGS